MEFIETCKGKPLLILDGFRYRLFRKTEELSHWRCVKERSTRCKGMVKIKSDASVTESKPHQCVSNAAEIEVSKATYECRKRAREDLDTPIHKIYKDVFGNILSKGTDIVAEVKKYESAKTSLCRIRRTALEELRLPDEAVQIQVEPDIVIYTEDV